MTIRIGGPVLTGADVSGSGRTAEMVESDGGAPCTRGETAAAWGVHAVTATGVLCGVFALTSIADGNAKVALLWMMVAQIVDGIDGAAARAVDVERVTPGVNGHLLDLLIDFTCCCVAPAAFLYQFGQLSQPASVLGVALVMLSSLYWMSSSDQEAPDNYFNGFPSVWNLVVTVFFVLHTNHTVNLLVVFILAVLSFTKVKFLHPVRVRELREVNLPIMIGWVITMTWLIVDPDGPWLAKAFQYIAVGHQVVMTVRRTWFVEPEPAGLKVPTTH
jgi:phosphatidylcholine synthase